MEEEKKQHRMLCLTKLLNKITLTLSDAAEEDGKKKNIFSGRMRFINKFLVISLVAVLGVLSVVNVVEAAKAGHRAYSINVNDNPVIYMTEKQKAEEALATYLEEKADLVGEEVYVAQRIDIVEVRTKDVLTKKVDDAVAALDVVLTPMVVGVAIQVDGKTKTCVGSAEIGKGVLQKIKDSYVPAEDNVKALDVKFRQQVDLVPMMCDASQVASAEDACQVLLTPEVKEEVHVVVKGENLWNIAAANHTSVADLISINPQLDADSVMINDKVTIAQEVPVLNVVTVLQKVQTNEIAYETKYVTDRQAAKGTQKVTKEGQSGKEEVTLTIVQENGREISRVRVASTVLEEPVQRVIAVGGALTTASRSGGSTAASKGVISWPKRGLLTCLFAGYRGHTGLDIDGNTGDTVKAAASGTVYYAGWLAGYGYIVKIDHDGGLATWYAHLSKISVSVGDSVSKGDKIGELGSTGNSTGSHLHFEVRVNGAPQNPLDYLP